MSSSARGISGARAASSAIGDGCACVVIERSSSSPISRSSMRIPSESGGASIGMKLRMCWSSSPNAIGLWT